MTHDNSTYSRSGRSRIEEDRQREEDRARGPGAGAVMRVIVPLQGVVQGRGGVVLGSVIPCALFYFLQVYLKRHRSERAPREEVPPPPRRPSRSPRKPALVSSRALHVIEDENSPYYRGWQAYKENPYDAEHNPDGIIQMGLAENQLSLDLIEGWLKSHPEVSSWEGISDTSLSLRGIGGHQDYYGMPILRSVMADFMCEVMKAPFNPDKIVLTAGATPAIEMLGFCLADPGNAFLVPSPYYPAFCRDLKWRAGVELVPVPCRSSDNFNVTINALDRAFSQTKKRGLTIRALLISNPSNPVGNILDSATLTMLLEFATEKNIHLICDEIYAGSVYDIPNFTSIAKVLESGEFDKSRVHIIYGTSKDLCLPGFRVGVIYSYNDKVLKAAQQMSRFCSVSSQTQHLLINMLSDAQFIQQYLSENQRRLRKTSLVLTEGLKEAGIKYVKSNAGLYCWVEMGSLMPSYSEKGELNLWDKLLNEAKINVTPGSACYCIEPGWFRICFSTLSCQDMTVALRRIQEFSRSCKRSL